MKWVNKITNSHTTLSFPSDGSFVAQSISIQTHRIVPPTPIAPKNRKNTNPTIELNGLFTLLVLSNVGRVTCAPIPRHPMRTSNASG